MDGNNQNNMGNYIPQEIPIPGVSAAESASMQPDDNNLNEGQQIVSTNSQTTYTGSRHKEIPMNSSRTARTDNNHSIIRMNSRTIHTDSNHNIIRIIPKRRKVRLRL